MQKETITINLKKDYLVLCGVIVAVISIAGAVFWARAAFIEPTVGPASSNQDFAQNILGANNADNDFMSSAVVSNPDGSIIERLQGIQDDYVYSFFTSMTKSQKNQIWDDRMGGEVATSSGLAAAYAGSVDMNKEEGEWASTTDISLGAETIASGVVKRDQRTGLYWSDCYSSAQDGTCDNRSNSFTLDGSVADADDGLDAEGGQAVDFCESLSLDADDDGTDETSWYLPSQKELMQAYINGAGNNLPNPDHVYWSATENYKVVGDAWNVYLSHGSTYDNGKSNNAYARCIHR